METNYIGKKVYYINRYFNVVYCTITDIVSTDLGTEITVKTEYGRTYHTYPDAIVNNKITKFKETPSKSVYLQCKCGSSRFNIIDEELTCVECLIPYKKDEIFSFLDEIEELPKKNEKKEVLH